MRCLAVVLLVAPAWASEADIQSSACRDALAALQAHESALAAASAAAGRPATGDPAWRALRAKAARICLGGAPDAPPPRGATSPGIAVPPVTAAPSAPSPPRPVPPPLPARTLPSWVTLCDGSGCWTSDGERLPQLGRSPSDPRVHCAIQGRVVLCQ
jgi:hypothetical protein